MTQVMNSAHAALMRRLDEAEQRYQTLQESLNDPAVLANAPRLVAATKEAGQLEPLVRKYRDYRKARDGAADLRRMGEDRTDPEMAQLAAEELPAAEELAGRLLEELKDEFLAAEDAAVNSFFLEIRAGTE